MALPTFVAKGTFASGIGDVTPGLPAGIAADDLLLLAVESAKQAASAPSGWTQCPSSPQENSGGSAGGSNAVRITAFYRIATGSDTDPTVTDTGDHTTALIVAYRGVNTSSPFNTSAGAGYSASTTITAPGVTTTVADCMIVHLIGSDRDSNSTTSMSGWTNAALANVTERHEQTVNAGFGGGIFVVDGEKATAGVVGDTTGTYTVSEEHASITLALQPPATAPVLDAASGSYAITGSAATTTATRALAADSSSYAITGSAATLARGYNLSANPGAYTITGSAATTTATRSVNAAAGSYAITGSAATLARQYPLNAQPGSYTLTGSAAGLTTARAVDAQPGSYALSGAAASLIVTRSLDAQAGTFAITGSDASLEYTPAQSVYPRRQFMLRRGR